ncbi:MAG: glycosyltransferase [Firmicutes bacterium]|nr:glycosyltransferase [Bacillota bacterium]
MCFEGPDLYSQAGGLGVRMTGLSRSLAEAGFLTHLIFVGDPGLPGREDLCDGKLVLHRWCQWISQYHPEGVYQAEESKLYDFNRTVPWHILDNLVRPALATGRRTVIMGEDWHTAHCLAETSDLLHYNGLRHHALMTWNANNPMGFEKIDWARLNYVSFLTTVSRYMKHYMWRLGVNPVVIPNGIPGSLLVPPPVKEALRLRRALVSSDLLLVKVGRWDPDKRWNMAVDAVAQLRAVGERPSLLARGGIEPHEGEVLHNARLRGLTIKDIRVDIPTTGSLAAELEKAGPADVYNLKFFVPPELLRVLYHAADAVLANSGMEPFGLVGLEVMAAGGVAFTGATGEDYARAFENAIVLETDDPSEIVSYAAYLRHNPKEAERLRESARETARKYTWDGVVKQLVSRLEFLGLKSLVVPGKTKCEAREEIPVETGPKSAR